MTVGPTQRRSATIDATIASSGSLSGVVNMSGHFLAGIIMPSAWDAASLTFQACETSNGTFFDVYKDDGTELSYTVAASRYVVINPANFIEAPFIKVRSGTSSSAVNQTAERVIQILAYNPNDP